MRTKALLWSLLTGLILGIIAWFIQYDLYTAINNYLYELQISMIWNLHRTLFAVTLGLIPIWAYLGWLLIANQSARSLVMQNVYVVVCMLVLSLLAYGAIDKYALDVPVFAPYSVLFEPFKWFWNYWLAFASILVLVFLLIRKAIFLLRKRQPVVSL